MKTRAIAASALVALLLAGVVAVSFAHNGLLGGSSAGNSTQTGEKGQHGDSQHDDDQDQANQQQGNDDQDTETINLTVGQTFTASNLKGHFSLVSNDDEHENWSGGISTGSFTFKVTSVTGESAILTVTSGTFTINKTTYAVSTGTVHIHGDEGSGEGNGTASGGVTFFIHVSGLQTGKTPSVDAIRLEATVGKSVYQVLLWSHVPIEDDSEGD